MTFGTNIHHVVVTVHGLKKFWGSRGQRSRS